MAVALRPHHEVEAMSMLAVKNEEVHLIAFYNLVSIVASVHMLHCDR
jgi:hypothetical protein